MKKEFRIVALHALPDEGVMLTVVPVFSMRSDQVESHIPDPSRVIVGPGLQTDDAKVMQEMMKGVLDELDRRYGNALAQQHFSVNLALSKKEYEELGMPLVNQIVTINIEKGEEPCATS